MTTKQMKTKRVQFEFPLHQAASFQFEGDSSPILRYFRAAFEAAPDANSQEIVDHIDQILKHCKARMYFNIIVSDTEILFEDVKKHNDLFDL